MRPAISDRRQATRPAGGQGWSGTSGREIVREALEGTVRAEHLGNRSSWNMGPWHGRPGAKKGQDVPAEEFASNLPSGWGLPGSDNGQLAGSEWQAEWERE